MLPLSLTIEGIYSYQERQTIDFSSLTEAGLFGIFGTVGSGKSSILEAITFALYGETERLNSKEKRTYNMLNLKSNHFYIDFEFLNFENKTFRVIREFKRNSKRFDDVKSPMVQFYEKKNNQWIPLTHNNPQEIIGLSYQNFKRTIIIPQGQFKEFIELGAKDRANMMKEIFNLQKFDLSENVSKIRKITDAKLSFEEGKLNTLEDVTQEIIDREKELFSQETERKKSLEIAFNNIKTQYEQLKRLREEHENFNQKKKEFFILQQQKPNIEALEKKITTYEKTEKIFQQLLINKRKAEKEVSIYKSKKDKDADILTQTEKRIEENAQKINNIQEQYNQLPESKAKEEDLKQILSIFPLIDNINYINKRAEDGKNAIKGEEDKLIAQKEEINALELSIEDLKKQRINNQFLIEVENWYGKYDMLLEKREKQSNKIKDIEDEINKHTHKFSSFPIFKKGFNENYKELIEADIERIKEERKILLQKKNSLDVQRQLALYTKELHNGEACPLCGSLEHPHITHFEDVSNELSFIENSIESLETKEKELRNEFSEIEKLLERISLFKNQLESEKEIISSIDSDIKIHTDKFVWKEFSINDKTFFIKKKEFLQSLENKIEEKEKLRSETYKNIEKIQNNLVTYRKAVEKFNNEIASTKGNIASKKESLKLLTFEEYENKEISVLQNEYDQLAVSNSQTEATYQSLIEEKNKLTPLLSEYKATLKNTTEILDKWIEEYTSIEKNIVKSLQENGISSIEEVKNILSEHIDDIIERKKEIQNFYINYTAIEKLILEMEKKLSSEEFNEETFKNVALQFAEKEKSLKESNQHCIKIATELERLLNSFETKKTILKSVEQLKKRSENIRILDNLFKGQGFVQYISSIYLQQLCEHANERFHRMTRGQLSLQVNENNDFEIIDYLNEGRSRSVKTLSGGQAFQVSLSLALALAESVQSEALSKRNFFFIDEGFGTQDSESVNIVFETISNLLKENRIVGIISHVEELKERIPISLNITKDTVRGSLISMS